ncbi:MAG: ribonuclease J [Alphaproteobacteria bacterium]|nr:ribonuclease J [Alphaproteobacteria bacterium]
MFNIFKKKKASQAPKSLGDNHNKKKRRGGKGKGGGGRHGKSGGKPHFEQKDVSVVKSLKNGDKINAALSQMNTDINDTGVYFGALGGMEEIGCNMYLYGTGGDWLIVDLGIGFPNNRVAGADKLIPDVSFLKKIKGRILGILLTHAHYDHFAAIPEVWNEIRCPIYGPPFALAMLKNMLNERGLTGKVPLNSINPHGQRFQLGAFDVEFMPTTHSTPQSNFIILRTEQGMIVHTGDFTLDPAPELDEPMDLAKLAELGAEGVLALMPGSTNACVPGGKVRSDKTAAAALEKEISAIKSGKIVITCFSTNIARIQIIYKIAQKLGRELVVAGRSLVQNIAAAKSVGYLKDFDYIAVEDAAKNKLPDSAVIYLCTGTQGEPRSTMTRIASGTYRDLELHEGDTVIYSSRVIPGNERAIFAAQNAFAARKINVMNNLVHPNIHASGHATHDEIQEVMNLLKPRFVIPVHGEPMMTKAVAEIAWECGLKEKILKDGEFVVFDGSDEQPRIVETVETGEIAFDGNRRVDPESREFSARRKMNENGIVFVSLTLDKKGLVGKPEISSYGLFETEQTGIIKSQISNGIKENIKAISPAELIKNTELAKQAAISAVNKVVRKSLDKKPAVEVHITKA